METGDGREVKVKMGGNVSNKQFSGAQAKNIFWQVSGQAGLGTAADFKGIIFSQTQISLTHSSLRRVG